MTLLRLIALVALLLCGGATVPLTAADAKVPSMTGVIDKLDADNAKVFLSTVNPNPAKVKSMVVNIDKTSAITIDKVASAFGDLKVGDHVVVKYSQGVALTVVVTRAPPATPPVKP